MPAVAILDVDGALAELALFAAVNGALELRLVHLRAAGDTELLRLAVELVSRAAY
jgi:hypothetical protein